MSGAAVTVMTGMVPPSATETLELLGVRLKSGHVPDVTVTTSGDVVMEPLEVMAGPPVLPACAAVSAGPLDPAKVASPEYAADITFCPSVEQLVTYAKVATPLVNATGLPSAVLLLRN